ncbi:3-(3-hydroxy-phenyl)propionate/3-hydroxycinnamic acid hydroxylase [Cyphellophora attinorum]|uniref:3-(3-hydroxy-phenyl)propionate/3-hydroxycinnamic acid hydroxylase n=1 Tax=Cyphellophora attinorum TaxID=1664694 RepID=A0A0N1H3Y9_9EURO|nr:3-(3-hydroxy-phenyl)propionate/3-hydroxycinnamic acid hydroxylase [Phialophora attinorum]KPI35262.1 3-(3-hydroxy-phenyl)propionate/3-hydroxycinnamic acid hydroxylase [Phialophora attinorum]
MADEKVVETVDKTHVVICGGGPTGVVLSALLHQQGVPNIVLERETDITTDPRGIALDEDGIRVLQAVGVYDKIYTDIGTCMGEFHFITGRQSTLHKRPMLKIDYSTTEGGTGHVGFICHKQPALEKAIRDVLRGSSYSDFRTRATVVNVEEIVDETSEESSHVLVTYEDLASVQRSIKARFLVGADGKTGYVRKKYLEQRRVRMDRCEGTYYEETWVALNWKIVLPTRDTHPDFPLWALGYSPEDVYDLFFPTQFRFLCNPNRAAVCGRFGPPEDRLWRFEFAVHEGEDPTKMASYQQTSRIIKPYITHSGSRYGLAGPVSYPEDCITTLRSRAFGFSARSCNVWASGRVIVAGDAAHVFPPFGGQGITSGFRDSLGLAWRLALLYRQPRHDHTRLLRGWYVERKQQLDASLAATIRNGEYVTESNPVKLWLREWSLYLTQLVPAWRRDIEKGPRLFGMTRYRYETGLPFLDDGVGGLLLPQVYLAKLDAEVGPTGRSVAFSDDIIFAPTSSDLLRLVVLAQPSTDIHHLLSVLKEFTATLESICPGIVHAKPTVIVHSVHPHAASILPVEVGAGLNTELYRLASGEEFASDPVLCEGRPAPRYYEAERMGRETKGRMFILVRPDRFVYAASRDRAELMALIPRLRSDFGV